MNTKGTILLKAASPHYVTDNVEIVYHCLLNVTSSNCELSRETVETLSKQLTMCSGLQQLSPSSGDTVTPDGATSGISQRNSSDNNNYCSCRDFIEVPSSALWAVTLLDLRVLLRERLREKITSVLCCSCSALKVRAIVC